MIVRRVVTSFPFRHRNGPEGSEPERAFPWPRRPQGDRAWNLSSKPGRPEGGEAMGMRALVRYLQVRYGA